MGMATCEHIRRSCLSFKCLFTKYLFLTAFVSYSPTGGCDKGYRPRIARLRPGSAAHRSDALAVGDYIESVNGTPTVGLSHNQIIGLLKEGGTNVDIGIEYEVPSLRKYTNNAAIVILGKH